MESANDRLLERDSRIRLLFGDISLQEFITRLPSVHLRPEVNNDVVESFKIVHKLLIHAYFEYLFIDVAVAKALHSLEMALKIRYKELTSLEWKKNAPLKQLLDWFRSGLYFEIDDLSFFDRVRKSRNYFSHPMGFNVAGRASLHWIDTIVGLINDVHDDTSLRKQRKVLEKQFQELIDIAVKEGIKLKQGEAETLIYSSAGVVVNNKLTPCQYSFALLPIFNPDSAEVKQPIFLITADLSIFSSAEIVVNAEDSGEAILLSRNISLEQKTLIEKFSEQCKTEGHYSVVHGVLLHEANKFIISQMKTTRLM